ncbi:MAG: lyase [Sphingomonadales bacterium]|jgi:virginiamycin B lyase
MKNLPLMFLVLLFIFVASNAFAQHLETRIYDVPDGARPHDVAPAPDGLVWYTAQRQGALGILDPKTGDVRQIPLGEGSSPHGVIQGPDGAAWITDGGQNAIVRFDPKTEKIDVYPLPENTDYTNLNTGAFDDLGVLWFTGQAGIIGRYDPMLGNMVVMEAPKGRGPYGIAETPLGDIYFASLAGSYVGYIDRDMEEVKVLNPPTPGQGARRLWSDSDGNIWITEWNSGQLTRYRPFDGDWKSYKLPGDNPKAYAVYVDDRDIVWVSDFSANAVLSFDPKTEEFTATYPGSGPNANVRQILGRPGEVWLPESGTNRLMVIYTSKK